MGHLLLLLHKVSQWLLKNVSGEQLRDGSAVKSTCCSAEDLGGFSSQHSQPIQFQSLMPSSGLSRHCMYIYLYTCRQKPIYIKLKKIFFKRKSRKNFPGTITFGAYPDHPSPKWDKMIIARTLWANTVSYIPSPSQGLRLTHLLGKRNSNRNAVDPSFSTSSPLPLSTQHY